MMRNGSCDIFPVCEKMLEGVGDKIIANGLCDGCPHWHEDKQKIPKLYEMQSAAATIREFLDEEGAAFFTKERVLFCKKNEIETYDMKSADVIALLESIYDDLAGRHADYINAGKKCPGIVWAGSLVACYHHYVKMLAKGESDATAREILKRDVAFVKESAI